MVIENPENLRIGLEDAQKELERENQALFERLSIVEEQIAQYQSQLVKLLDLYLEGNFPKEVLTEGNPASKRLLFNLGKEQNDLMGHIRDVTITNDQLNYIEGFCAKIRK